MSREQTSYPAQQRGQNIQTCSQNGQRFLAEVRGVKVLSFSATDHGSTSRFVSEKREICYLLPEIELGQTRLIATLWMIL